VSLELKDVPGTEDDVSVSDEELEVGEKVVSLVELKDVPGTEDEEEVELGVVLLLLTGGSLEELVGSGLVELVVGGVSVVSVVVSVGGSVVSVGGSEVSVGGSEVSGSVSVSVGVGVSLSSEVVALLSWRFASCKMEVARAASARWTASIAWWSDGNTPSLNRSGRNR
jgi:hypothetical protein